MHFAPSEKTDSAFDRKPTLSATTAAPRVLGPGPPHSFMRSAFFSQPPACSERTRWRCARCWVCMCCYTAGTSVLWGFSPALCPHEIAALFCSFPCCFGICDSGSVLHVYLTEAESELTQSSVLPGHRALRAFRTWHCTPLFPARLGGSPAIFLGLLLSKGFSESR